MEPFAKILTICFCMLGLLSATPSHARGGGAANLLNSPGYQRAQKDARDNYLRRYYGEQQVHVTRRKHRHHPH